MMRMLMRQIIKSRSRPKLRALSVALTVFLLSAVLTSAVYAATSSNTVVDSTGFVGFYTSLALNSSGYPVISYYDDSNKDLKVAVCGDATCTTKTLTTVDSSGTVGYSTSLALKSGNITVSNSSFNENAYDGISLGGDWGNTADGPCPPFIRLSADDQQLSVHSTQHLPAVTLGDLTQALEKICNS